LSQDFWRHSGFHLLRRDAGGRLLATDDFLRAYYLRPEMRPVEASCAREIALHDELMQKPRMQVAAAQLEAMADADVRSNYRVVLAFRDRLLAAPTLEACYFGLFSGGAVSVPPLFIDQLAQIILRNILDEAEDALELRAAEIFYREQKASLREGAIMLADLETITMHAADRATAAPDTSLVQLIVDAQAPLRTVELEVLDRGNAQLYWLRDECHDFVISMNHGRAALAAFCRVLERWTLHLAGVKVAVNPVARIEDTQWAWHIGLDAQSTSLLNAMWRGEAPQAGRLASVLALFRMDFADAREMRSDVAGRPVYLALSMADDGVVHMKPQNLLLNLPLAKGK
jgi:Family of unknown function (DUF6352)